MLSCRRRARHVVNSKRDCEGTRQQRKFPHGEESESLSEVSRNYNASINIMPHYPPPWQCWGIGGDLNFANFKYTTYWARQSVKSRPLPHSKVEGNMGNLIVSAFN